MSTENKGYRGFNEDFTLYRVDDKTFSFNDVSAKTMAGLRRDLLSLNEEAKNVKGADRFIFQEKASELSKKILTLGLKDFNYDEMSDIYSESDLQGMSGDVIGFLSVKRSKKELELLIILSEETKTNSDVTPT